MSDTLQAPTPDGPVPRRGRRTVVLWTTLIGTALALLEVGSAIAIGLGNRRLDEPVRRRATILADQRRQIGDFLDNRGSTLVRLDPVLGWDYRPDYVSELNTISSQGLRRIGRVADAPGGALRVAAFGDSFVYGAEVGNEDAWTLALEERSPGVEVLNYGVGGYGMDQAYLRYLRDGAALQPDIVLIGFAPVDLRRLVNVFRPFISSLEFPLTKPRFVESAVGSGLSRVPPPWRGVDDYVRASASSWSTASLGERDWWYRPDIWENPFYDWSATVRLMVGLWVRLDRRYVDGDRPVDARSGLFRPESEAFRLQVALADSFAVAVGRDGPVPALLMLPDRAVMSARAQGRSAPWDPLMTELRELGVEVLDASLAFPSSEDASGGTWFAPGGHFSPLGNQLVAEWLAGELPRLQALACTQDEPRADLCG